jgi:hypothetical protein
MSTGYIIAEQGQLSLDFVSIGKEYDKKITSARCRKHKA